VRIGARIINEGKCFCNKSSGLRIMQEAIIILLNVLEGEIAVQAER
jgi:hypothetical protein